MIIQTISQIADFDLHYHITCADLEKRAEGRTLPPFENSN